MPIIYVVKSFKSIYSIQYESSVCHKPGINIATLYSIIIFVYLFKVYTVYNI